MRVVWRYRGTRFSFIHCGANTRKTKEREETQKSWLKTQHFLVFRPLPSVLPSARESWHVRFNVSTPPICLTLRLSTRRMAKKGGVGKRGVGGKSNTKKTNKAALRAGFELRHIDQVRQGAVGMRGKRGGRATRIWVFLAACPCLRLPRPRPPVYGLPARTSQCRVQRLADTSKNFSSTLRSGKTSAPKSTSCAARAAPWSAPSARPAGEFVC